MDRERFELGDIVRNRRTRAVYTIGEHNIAWINSAGIYYYERVSKAK